MHGGQHPIPQQPPTCNKLLLIHTDRTVALTDTQRIHTALRKETNLSGAATGPFKRGSGPERVVSTCSHSAAKAKARLLARSCPPALVYLRNNYPLSTRIEISDFSGPSRFVDAFRLSDTCSSLSAISPLFCLSFSIENARALVREGQKANGP